MNNPKDRQNILIIKINNYKEAADIIDLVTEKYENKKPICNNFVISDVQKTYFNNSWEKRH